VFARKDTEGITAKILTLVSQTLANTEALVKI